MPTGGQIQRFHLNFFKQPEDESQIGNEHFARARRGLETSGSGGTITTVGDTRQRRRPPS